MNKILKGFIYIFLAINFMGCATAPYIMPTAPTSLPGIYHRVEKGQTLWRISKVYNVDLDELIKVNHISDIRNIEIGQLIFIPNRHNQQIISVGDDFIWPIKGRVISSFMETKDNMKNKGIDIQPGGIKNVLSARSGKVVFYAPNFGRYGKTIIIDHGDGFSTVYARNSEIFVKAGEYVERGKIIAKAGNAGRDKDVYLHFEVRKSYIPQNPIYYLP